MSVIHRIKVIQHMEFRFRVSQVFIKKVGNTTVLISADNPWGPLCESLYQFSSDFMSDRNQPTQQTRKIF